MILPREALPRLHRALVGWPVSLGVAWAEEARGEGLSALADARMYGHKRLRKAGR